MTIGTTSFKVFVSFCFLKYVSFEVAHLLWKFEAWTLLTWPKIESDLEFVVCLDTTANGYAKL